MYSYDKVKTTSFRKPQILIMIYISRWIDFSIMSLLEIKPGEYEYKIRDMEVESYKWSHFLANV